MYGLLIENISQFIQERYGNDKWNEIRRLAQIDETTFNTHTIYPDVYTKNIIDKACQVLKLSDKQFLTNVGESFVVFIGRYGYDAILSALGREFRDFLNSLDDLHEYLRLSYPRLRPPSYYCDNENENGLFLHYRTKRNFLLWYTVGQIIKVAKVFYDIDVEIELLQENQAINEYHFVLQLRFDNRVFLQRPNQSGSSAGSEISNGPAATQSRLNRLLNVASANGGRCPFSLHGSFDLSSASASPSPPPESIASSSASTLTSDTTFSIYKLPPISMDVFLDIFPFSIIYDSSMKIRQMGTCLQVVCPNILNQSLTQNFTLIKPKIDFTWDSILRHTNTTFELRLAILLKTQGKSRRILSELRNSDLRTSVVLPNRLDRADSITSYYDAADDDVNSETTDDNLSLFLQLKGQMIYFASWKCVAFLGAPNVASLDTLIKTGLYLNDLSMHDFSRDMVLAGQQQSAELKLALDQELHKSRQLEITIKKLDEERRRSDELLYQMINKLRIGEKNIETCQYFCSVTILFSDLIDFTEICSKIGPMQVVTMLNSVYTKFDLLCEKHDVYKVETIGDAYMVAGGLPVHQEESSFLHARKVCKMSMDMIEEVYHIKDPSRGRHLKIRIGVHTGPVVGGIVGQKMPRYCLFGDTVNTSSRMETSSLKMRVQISESTQRLLDSNEWDIRERGTIRLKGKGMMKTYWLYNRKYKPTNSRLLTASSTASTSSSGPVRMIDGVDVVPRSNGASGSNRVCPADTEIDAMETSSRPSFNAVRTILRRNSDSIHDSNYSLFVSDRIKRTCLIL